MRAEDLYTDRQWAHWEAHQHTQVHSRVRIPGETPTEWSLTAWVNLLPTEMPFLLLIEPPMMLVSLSAADIDRAAIIGENNTILTFCSQKYPYNEKSKAKQPCADIT